MFGLPSIPSTSSLLAALTEYAIVSTDDSGRIASWNTGAARTFGYSAEEAIGRPLTLLYDPSGTAQAAADRNLDAARDGGHVLEERWYVRKDGTRFFGAGMLGAIFDEAGRITGFVKLLHDDTERKTRDDALAQLRETAQAKEKLLRQFIHDARTPMSAITLWTSLIAEPEVMAAEQLTEALSAISRSADELQVIVEQLAASRAAG